VIVPDLLGNGDSDPAPYEYTMPDHARSLISFMDSPRDKESKYRGSPHRRESGAELTINWPER